MLALCWHIFRSWASFFRSWLALGRLFGVFCSCWSFFLRFGSLRVRFWSVQGQFWRVRTLIFRCFVAPAFWPCEKTPDAQKPQFSQDFYIFFTHRKLCALATKKRKIVPRACRTELPTKIVLKTRLGMDSRRVWRSLGRHLAGFCPLLGSSWPLLDASWASLGHFLGALGCLLAALGCFRAAF